MRTLLDFLPVAAFVVAYWSTGDFAFAVGVIMAAVVVQVAITWLVTRTVHRMLLISAALVVGLGAISLLLQNDLIFKWKPTVLNWLFAAVFLGSQFVGARPLTERLLGSIVAEQIRLARDDWRRLNLMWVAFFAVAGAANLFVAYAFEEAIWVNFKLFGLLSLTLVFIVLQSVWIAQRSQAPAEHGE